MLDAIKELIPLLDGVRSGAVWLVAAYFGLLLIEMLLIAGSILLALSWVVKLLLKLMGQDSVDKNNGSMYQWDDKCGRNIDALFQKESMKDLLEVIADDSGRLGPREMQRAIEKLKQ